MIEKIVHFADIHIYRDKLHHEYREIFEKVYKKLDTIKPDRIVIVGDTFNDFLHTSNESQILMGELFNNLSKYCPVIVTRGNHDFSIKNKNKIDSITPVVELINNPSVTYYDKTGFYKDDNITWVVWNHGEKISPWIDIPHLRDKTRTYIDLFHNPVNDCISHNGFKLSKPSYKTIENFDGDFSFFGDIHLLQFFRDKTAGYPSSLVQQNYGEKPNEHGFLEWNIKTKDVTFHEILNDRTLITFDVAEDFDYDNISLKNKFIGKNSEFKIKWRDISANVNNKENEIKLREYIKNTYNTTKLKIEKTPIYTDILSSQTLNEVIDVNNLKVQQEIIKEYLKLNKYKDDFIKEVMDLDDIINERLNLTERLSNLVWNIPKFWFNNFKSYGDGNVIDWSNTSGIIQISGVNKQGKTTILDALSYILYGTTMSTLSKQKHGDNRYINNKRDLDTCDGGAVIDINSELFTLYRKSTRTWSRGKLELNGCSTVLEFYKGTEMTEANKLTGELRTKTQEMINKVLGDFSDFIRLVLTTADNLNDLLSMDRATFIDSIVKDAGYDIFEKKLAEFKEYRKSLSDEKIVINTIEQNDKLNSLNESIKDNKEKLDDGNDKVNECSKKILDLNKDKDDLSQQLNQIDEKISNLNIEDLRSTISDNKELLEMNSTKVESINEKIQILPETFNQKKYDDLLKKSKDYVQEKSDKKLKISDTQTLISNKESAISKIDMNIQQIKKDKKQSVKDELNDKEIELSEIRTQMKTIVSDYTNKINIRIKDNEFQIKTVQNRLNSIKEIGKTLNSDVRNLESSIESTDTKLCPTCKREMEDEHIEHVKEEISKKKLKMKTMMTEYKDLEPQIEICQKNIDDDEKLLVKIQNREVPDDLKLELNKFSTVNLKSAISDLNKTLEDIGVGIFDNETKRSIGIKIDEKTKIEDNIEKLQDEITKLGSDIDVIKEEMSSLEEQIQELENTKKLFESKKDLIVDKDKLLLRNDNIKLKIENDESLIERYNQQISLIKSNQKINTEISVINDEITELDKEKDELLDEIKDITVAIEIDRKKIEYIVELIKKYKEQEKKEEIYKIYMKSIHRDGIPTYLLKKSIHIINQELSNLLSNVDFTVFFDENLILKMSNNTRLDVTQNSVESSGAERTFISVCLQLALKSINAMSRPNFVIFDEIMGKLVEGSVGEFTELLDTIKEKLDKVIIIEHTHPINYDGLIMVNKDTKGISTLVLDI